jgi:hypothetical protein
MFSLPGMPLVTHREGSHYLACYWSPTKKVLIIRHATGHPQRRFSSSGMLLVTHRVCSHYLACYWSPIKYVLTTWHATGHPQRRFSSPGMLLVTHRSVWDRSWRSMGGRCRPSGFRFSTPKRTEVRAAVHRSRFKRNRQVITTTRMRQLIATVWTDYSNCLSAPAWAGGTHL